MTEGTPHQWEKEREGKESERWREREKVHVWSDQKSSYTAVTSLRDGFL